MDFFQNESETCTLQEFHVENRLDRVSWYGSLDITHDASGLELALKLKALLDGVVEMLQKEQSRGQLPATVTLQSGEQVDNPFQ